MADDMESDTCSGFKRSFTEIQHTHYLETPIVHQQQEQEPSTSLSISTVITQDSNKFSDIASPIPRKDDPEIIEEAGSSLFKKVRCSYEKEESERNHGFTEEKQELGSVNGKVTACDLVSGFPGCEGNVVVCGKKVQGFGVEVEAREKSEVGCGDGVEESVNDVERRSFCGLVGKEEKDSVKIEADCSGTQECAKVNEEKEYEVEVEMGPIIEGDSGERKEMKFEAFLEAEKKRLLAELEHGAVFEDKTLSKKVSGLAGFSQNDEKGSGCQEVRKPAQIDGVKVTDASVRRSLKIEVIDDTALIESIPVPKTGNGCVKDAGIVGATKMIERYRKKGEKEQEGDVKKARRSRRKAKDTKKVGGMREGLNNLIHNVEDQDGGLQNGKQTKIMYSRKEMEVLRDVNIVEQRKMWRDIYTGLGPAVMKEYDDLGSSKHHNHIFLNFNPQQHSLRKPDAPGILREEYSQNVDNESACVEDYEVNADTLNEDSYKVLEGECSEDYDSDEDYGSIQRPAFLVEGEPDFESGPPEDGLEYLRRVRWEAAHIPKVKVAKLDKSKVKKEQSVYMPQIPDIAWCPEHLLPLKQWEDSFLGDFSKLRLVLSGIVNSSSQHADKLHEMFIVQKENDSSRLPESIIVEKVSNLRIDEVHSCQPVDGFSPKSSIGQPSALNTEDDKTPPSNQNSKTCLSDDSGNYPTLSAILRMDSVARVSTLRKRISSVEPLSTLSRKDCVWLFSLCATVDTPLDADTCAALRSLLRKCASLRSGKSELDDEVVMLNILATISGRYFGQSDH